MKPTNLKSIPVVIQLYPQHIQEADLMRELKINKHDLDRELTRQPARFAWWAALYSQVAAKVELLKERLDTLEARLFIRYVKERKTTRVTDIKYHIQLNSEYQALKTKLRKWQDSERLLKYSAMRGFEQRTFTLNALAANKRREWDSEVNSKRRQQDD